ncbi:MAG: DUF1571 domain-containing protein [Aeoliella sp.]
MEPSYATVPSRVVTLLGVCAGIVLLAAPMLADEAHSSTPTEQVATFTLPADSVVATSHPLAPAIALAKESHRAISENIRDYTCTLVRRERVKGKLGKHQFLNVKVRHEVQEDDEIVTPFGVYLRFAKPASLKGREALYVAGRNAGKVFVRRGGQRRAYLSSYIKPDSPLAMKENRYPITDIGLKRMAERLIAVMERDSEYDECQVKFFADAKVGDRICTRIEVIHPIERDHFSFQKSMVFLDDEDKLPIAYASYYWPREPGGKPRLLEEYVYTDIQLNVGLTDTDFDRKNPDYGFERESR